ncbi:hypothetical protein F5Y12DRAFT_779766 [Xylaria sp. FL1777]|nr:hypothetical protein F5Y12DRAFT_779766 [Xylaria sp. FL1777]
MQFLKSLLLTGLLSVQALGAAVPAPVQARQEIAPLPSPITFVDVNEVRREQSSFSLGTDGLLTCIAVVARDRSPRASGEWDKILAHISSRLCTDRTGPSMDAQIDNFFALYDMARFITPELVVLIPPPEMPGQNEFNEYVVTKVFMLGQARGFITSYEIRDNEHVMEAQGSRLWIDGTKSIYWSLNKQLFGPPPPPA